MPLCKTVSKDGVQSPQRATSPYVMVIDLLNLDWPSLRLASASPINKRQATE